MNARIILICVVAALAGTTCKKDKGSDEPKDPCFGVDLPPCPAECPAAISAIVGTPCEQVGGQCGNEIGDGCKCVDGTWNCAPHKPLPAGQCTLVCQRVPVAAGSPTPTSLDAE